MRHKFPWGFDYHTNFSDSNDKKLIIFLHGLSGGVSTWIRSDGNFSIAEYLLENDSVCNYFDIVTFSYKSKILSIPPLASSVLTLWNKGDFNLSVESIVDILHSALGVKKFKNKKIILVGHSLGGIIALKYLLKYEDKRIIRFFALAPPLKGSVLPNLVKLFVPENIQLVQLSMNSSFINKLEIDFNENYSKLPFTYIFCSRNDNVILEFWNLPKYNIKRINVIEDHSTINTPNKVKTKTTLETIIDELDSCSGSELNGSIQYLDESNNEKVKNKISNARVKFINRFMIKVLVAILFLFLMLWSYFQYQNSKLNSTIKGKYKLEKVDSLGLKKMFLNAIIRDRKFHNDFIRFINENYRREDDFDMRVSYKCSFRQDSIQVQITDYTPSKDEAILLEFSPKIKSNLIDLNKCFGYIQTPNSTLLIYCGDIPNPKFPNVFVNNNN